jgi:hypothetical protein
LAPFFGGLLTASEAGNVIGDVGPLAENLTDALGALTHST